MTDKGVTEGAAERPTEPSLGVKKGDRVPKIYLIVIIALISVAFSLAWFASLRFLNTAFWENDFVIANRWMIPVGVLFFSLLVGLCGKYLRAPNVINGGMEELLKGGSLDYTTFPGTLLTSFFSLLSGAAVGPEAPLTFLTFEVAEWIGAKIKLAEETKLGFVMAALASAFNGLFGNPLFSALLATELQGNKGSVRFLAWNLLAGVIGYMCFALIGFPAFANSIPLTPVNVLTLTYALLAIALGAIGALLAISIGISFKGIGRIMNQVFKDRFVERVLAAGVIIAIVVYFVPEVMFSGESQINAIVANPAAYGVLVLLGFAILKVLLLAISSKGGYLGGPIFPTMFTSITIALAISLLFPSVPVGLLVSCIVAAAITVGLGAPFAAILLTVTVVTSTTYEIGYIGLATATALIIGAAFKERIDRRGARQGDSADDGPT
ncbi:MAG: chloride channel protein [Halobacteriota archaeon]